jgi:hypothetical protein
MWYLKAHEKPKKSNPADGEMSLVTNRTMYQVPS